MSENTTIKISYCACGSNEYGQLGDDSQVAIRSDARQLTTCSLEYTSATTNDTQPRIIGCFAGGGFSIVLVSHSNRVSLYGCGSNKEGQLGPFVDETLGDSHLIPKFANLHLDAIPVISVACGHSHTLILLEDGSAFAFGSNRYGECGNAQRGGEELLDVQPLEDDERICDSSRTISSRRSKYSTPVAWNRIRLKNVSGGFRHVSAGVRHSVLITSEGKALHLGLGFHIHKPDAGQQVYQLSAPVPFELASCGSHHSVLLDSNHQLWVYGTNRFSQLGVDDSKFKVSQPMRLDLEGMQNDNDQVVEIASGWFHNAIRTIRGSVYLWGRNDMGQLGASKDQRIHKLVMHECTASEVFCGSEFSLIRTTKRELWATGWNEHGNLGQALASDGEQRVSISECFEFRRILQVDPGPSSLACGGAHWILVPTE